MSQGLADYSDPATCDGPCPHDLLWPTADAFDRQSLPDWAAAVLAAGEPAVVRRAPRQPAGRIPVGIRGATRGQRHAGWIEPDAIRQRLSPEALADVQDWLVPPRRSAIPALGLLAEIARLFDATGWTWGPTGAVGYELATGRAVCHVDSDIDILLRSAGPLPRVEAAALIERLERLAVRCDVQIETPAGGVAVADWAGPAREVLVKSDVGPFLSTKPWAAAIPEPGAPCQNIRQRPYR